MEKRNSVILIVALSVSVLILATVALLLKQRQKHEIWNQHDNLQVNTAKIETSEKQHLPEMAIASNTSPIQRYTLQNDDKELTEIEHLTPLVQHDILKVREALEKFKRPDLKYLPSGPERIAAHHKTLQIPGEELATLPTKALVDKVAASSLFVMMIVYPDADGGLERYAQSFNGVKVLLGRPDAAKVILEEYNQICDQISERALEQQFTWRFPIMEVLLSSKEMIKQLTDVALREQVIISIIKSVEARAKYDISQTEPVYGEATIEYSALAIANYLDSLNSSKYQHWFSQKRNTGLFTERALTYKESREVIDIGAEYVQTIKQGLNK